MFQRASSRAIPDCDDYVALREWMMSNDSGPVPETIVRGLLLRLMNVLFAERNILLLSSPINICGDIHGQFDDLLWLFAKSGAMDQSNPNLNSSFEPQSFLFLGDYVDRGYHSLNTFLFLACLKLQFPANIFLLRGNHESRMISTRYGFFDEVVLNYGHSGLWSMCNEVFDLLPVAAVVDRRIFAVHGGLSPKLPLAADISLLDRVVELPETGPLADLTWSDPENVRKWRHNTRGAGYLFGPNEVAKFNRINRIEFICRSHQLAHTGFTKFFETQTRKYQLITIWSAPNYSYRSGNDATIMKYATDGIPIDRLITFSSNPQRIEPRKEEEPVARHYFA